MNKLVSAIITTNNRNELFKKALRSVQQQTYKNIEIIVVDGGDTDTVKSYVKSYPNIIYFKNKNKNANVLRNLGIECAHGMWIAFLDDDDMWNSKKIELQLKCFEKYDIGLCYTGKNILNQSTKKLKYSYQKPKFKLHAKSIMWDNFIGTTSSIMISKHALFDINGFDEKMPALQDYDLYIRICQIYNVQGLDQPLITYLNNHPGNQTSKNKNNFKEACKLLKNKYKNLEYSKILTIALSKINIKRKIKEFYE